MTDELYTPTTDEVRDAYVDRKDFEDQVAHVDRRGDAIAEAEFDRWLTEHDRKVLYDYVSTKEAPVVHIECAEQIAWLQPRHDREVAEKAWDEGYMQASPLRMPAQHNPYRNQRGDEV